MDDNIHIKLGGSRSYVMRVTVAAANQSGDKMQVGLGTRDLVEARRRRDIVMNALNKALPLVGGEVSTKGYDKSILDD